MRKIPLSASSMNMGNFVFHVQASTGIQLFFSYLK